MRLNFARLALLGLATSAIAQSPTAGDTGERFLPLKYADLTSQQKAAVEIYQTAARRIIGGDGPFDIDSKLMARARASSVYVGVRSPELLELTLKTAFTLDDGAVPRKLNELAVMITARYWSEQYVWWGHHKLATQFNLGEDIIQAVASGKRPAKMQPDEEAVYNFCTELHENQQVSDATFEAAKKQLGGERGVVELMGIMSTYNLISMFLKVDRFPLPEGVSPELKPLK